MMSEIEANYLRKNVRLIYPNFSPPCFDDLSRHRVHLISSKLIDLLYHSHQRSKQDSFHHVATDPPKSVLVRDKLEVTRERDRVGERDRISNKSALRTIAPRLLQVIPPLFGPRCFKFLFDQADVIESRWEKSNPLLLISFCQREAILNRMIHNFEDSRELWSYYQGIPLEITLRE